MSNALIEVGDTVVVTSFLGVSRYKITRVTKTLAMSKRDSDGYEHRFYRDVNKGIRYPKDPWNRATYALTKQGQGKGERT